MITAGTGESEGDAGYALRARTPHRRVCDCHPDRQEGHPEGNEGLSTNEVRPMMPMAMAYDWRAFGEDGLRATKRSASAR